MDGDNARPVGSDTPRPTSVGSRVRAPGGVPVTVVHEPVTPRRHGMLPNFIVRCLTAGCGFAVDAHGRDADDAVADIAPTHAKGHRLIARPVDYTAPVFGPSHVLGRPVEQTRHPLYHRPGG